MAGKKRSVHPTGVAATSDGRVYVHGRYMDEYESTVLFELKKGKAALVQTFEDVEGMVAHERDLFMLGESVHRFDGKAWKVVETETAMHTARVIDGEIVGVGRDGAVGVWKKTGWTALAGETRNLHLTGVTKAGGRYIVCGSKGANTGVLSAVVEKKLAPVKAPARKELLGVTTLADGRILATGKEATVLVGDPTKPLVRVPSGKYKADLGNAVEWDGRVLIAARADGVLELVGDVLSTFNAGPAQGLYVAGDRLWKTDRKTGLAWWNKKAWAQVELTA